MLAKSELLGVFAGLVVGSAARVSDVPYVRRPGRAMFLPAGMQWDLLPPLSARTAAALSRAEQGAVERAAARRGARDAAILSVLLHAGARAGTVRLHGKGDEVRTIPLPAPARDRISAWLDERGRHPGPLWNGQRGPLTISGIVQVVLAAGAGAGIPACVLTAAATLTPPACARATPTSPRSRLYSDTPPSTRRPGTSISGSAENAAVIERIFDS